MFLLQFDTFLTVGGLYRDTQFSLRHSSRATPLQLLHGATRVASIACPGEFLGDTGSSSPAVPR